MIVVMVFEKDVLPAASCLLVFDYSGFSHHLNCPSRIRPLSLGHSRVIAVVALLLLPGA